MLTKRHTLNLRLDIVDGIGRFDLEGNGLTREGLDEDLHCEDLKRWSTRDAMKNSRIEHT